MPSGAGEKSNDQLLKEGRRYHRQGRPADALRCYQQVLSTQPECVDALYLMGMIRYRAGHVSDAVNILEQAVTLAPDHAMALGTLGQIMLDRREVKRAGVLFDQALKVEPNNPDLLYGSSLVHSWSGNLDAARFSLEKLLRHRPEDAKAELSLGNVLRRMGETVAAQAAYDRCLALAPDFAEAHNNLGALYQQRQRHEEARVHYEAAIRLKPDYAEAHSNLGAILDESGEFEQALASYQVAMDVMPSFVEAFINCGLLLSKIGDTACARQTLDVARRIDPDHIPARWASCIGLLSAVYPSEPERAGARKKYLQSLMAFARSIDLADNKTLQTICDMVGTMQPFQLAYQGENDRLLQQQYGELICNAMASLDRPMLPLPPPSPIRVGIVSAFFRDHSNWKCPLQGWSRHLGRFVQLIGFHVGQQQDHVTDQAEQMFAEFYRMPDEASLLQQIRQSRLHCLIYPELGMDPVTLRLATRRLAPLQCTSWGHPDTSGLPTMDWYLSSDLMEPDNTDDHYSERLVRLPGLSFSYRFEKTSKSRSPSRSLFGLVAEDVVYLCLQNLSKYLPQYDWMLAEIAAAVPGARMVFIEGQSGATRVLRQRLSDVFTVAGLDADRQLLFLPRLNKRDYRALNQIGDVFLDTPGWSGCNSSLEALQVGIPVVTLPGELMRSRHTTAFYQQMNWTSLVANDERQFVDLAIVLGSDPERRRECRQQILSSISALEGEGEAEEALAALLAAHRWPDSVAGDTTEIQEGNE